MARTAGRDNSSDYYVNGRKVAVKEVLTLLKDKGIDLDNNRFLILQGEPLIAANRLCCVYVPVLALHLQHVLVARRGCDPAVHN